MIQGLLSSCAECPTEKGRIEGEECNQKKIGVDVELAMGQALPGYLGYICGTYHRFWGKWEARKPDRTLAVSV